MYRVSVIMPVHNNDDTLEIAIESVLNQTIPGFELILVNDGSTDRSAEICERFAKQEPLLVEVIHQKHQGVFAALNKGILNSTGKYIYFANPHDHFDRRLLEANVNLAGEKDVDVVVFGFTTKTNLENDELEYHLPRMPLITSPYEFRNHFRNFYHFFPFELYNKMYRREYLLQNRLLFQTNKTFGKHYFSLQLFKHLGSIAFNRGIYMHRSNYPFRVREESVSYFELYKVFLTHFKQLLQYWGYEIEYRDLIAEECYTLIDDELKTITTKNSPLTYEQQIDYMNSILKDEAMQYHLEHLELLVDKTAYNRVLIRLIQNGNGKKVVDLMTRRKDAYTLKNKIKSFMRGLID